MSGEPDPLYVTARRVLLDALEALGPHADALILIGAQAIYLQLGDTDLAIAPYTTDCDIALDPRILGPDPKLENLMMSAGFVLDGQQPGIWRKPVADDEGTTVEVDLMVPEALGGGGNRGARLGEHGRRAARKGRGLECVVVDNARLVVTSLEDRDTRQLRVRVAGTAALLVAKLHKLADRNKARPGRRDDKDALDVYRLLMLPLNALVPAMRQLETNELCAEVTGEALKHLVDLFGHPECEGSQMAARALETVEDPQTVALSCSVLANELLSGCTTADG